MIARGMFPYLGGFSIAATAVVLLVRLSAVDADGLRILPLPIVGLLVALVAIALLGALVILLEQLDTRRPAAVLTGGVSVAVVTLCLAGTPLLVLPALGTTAFIVAWARQTEGS